METEFADNRGLEGGVIEKCIVTIQRMVPVGISRDLSLRVQQVDSFFSGRWFLIIDDQDSV